jgi:DNA-dependent RNA polymerase auxiliary subunit epsilon
MRDVKMSLDTARGQRLRTMNSLSKTRDEIEYLDSLTDRSLDQVLEKEHRRFEVLEATINKSRQRVLKAREKLAMTVNRNRALTELRRELQHSRWKDDESVVQKERSSEPKSNVRQVELKY